MRNYLRIVKVTANKLDAILAMLKEVKAQVQELHELQQAQLSLLAVMNRELINFMPHLIVILPGRKREKLDKSATRSSKSKNCMLRMKDSVSSVLWEESRLHFICPVTLQPSTTCGPYKEEGYPISMPTALLKTAVPILKMGLLTLQVILATQGMGSLVPNWNAVFPTDQLWNSESITALLGVVCNNGDKIQSNIKSAISFVQDTDCTDSMRSILALAAKVEEGKDVKMSDLRAGNWKPKHTGLQLVTHKKSGQSAWVSTEGSVAFKKYGVDAFEDILTHAKEEDGEE